MRFHEILTEDRSTLPPRLYHGTCAGHLDGIRQHGLLAATTTPKGGASRRGVYLTDDPHTAGEYGWLVCDRKHHGDHDIVVLAVDSSALDPNLLQPDDYDLQDQIQGGEIAGSEPIDPRLQDYQRWDEVPWAVSLAVTHQIFYAGNIPARALTQTMTEARIPAKRDLDVFPVRSKRDLNGLLRRFGWVRLALHDDQMFGWEASDFTHGDYVEHFGKHTNLNVALEDGTYIVEFSPPSAEHQDVGTTPQALRHNPIFQRVFGTLPVKFRDHNTWDDVDG